MKPTGPAIVRRLYHGAWEYQLLYANGLYSVFGATVPGGVLWVYETTQDLEIRAINRIRRAQWYKGDPGSAWWNQPGAKSNNSLFLAIEKHSKPYKPEP